MKKALSIVLMSIGLLTPTWATQSPTPARPSDSAVMSQKSIDWVKSNFESVKGKKFPVRVGEDGNILSSKKDIVINNAVDYIRLLASDLVAAKSTNKMMLLEGFVLFAIIQGDVFPVDYSNIATTTNGYEPLLKNAAKIAAYAMTYRMGVGVGGIGDDGAIRPTADILGVQSLLAGGKKIFYRSTRMVDGESKPEYEYLSYNMENKIGPLDSDSDKEEASITDATLNRQGAITQLRNSPRYPLQASALNDAFHILTTAADEAPTDPLYLVMYPNNIKRGNKGGHAPVGLQQDRNIDSILEGMGIKSENNTSLSPARKRK